MQSAERTVTDLIAKHIQADSADIDPDRTLADLGVDSLALVEICFEAEDALDIEIPYNMNEGDVAATTVGDLIGRVERALRHRRHRRQAA